MDQIKELEKYKILYDEGAISEEEFRKLKQNLLGLKSEQDREIDKQREREEALAEIEKMRKEESAKREEQARAEKAKAEKAKAEQARAEQERIRQEREKEEKARQELRAKEEQELHQKALEEERARLEAKHEYEMKQKAEQIARAQQSAKTVAEMVAKIILWVFTVLCTLVGIVSMIPPYSNSTVFDILTAVIFLIFGIMACPPITAKMKENDKLAIFCKYKIGAVILLVILWFVLAGVLLA